MLIYFILVYVRHTAWSLLSHTILNSNLNTIEFPKDNNPNRSNWIEFHKEHTRSRAARMSRPVMTKYASVMRLISWVWYGDGNSWYIISKKRMCRALSKDNEFEGESGASSLIESSSAIFEVEFWISYYLNWTRSGGFFLCFTWILWTWISNKLKRTQLWVKFHFSHSTFFIFYFSNSHLRLNVKLLFSHHFLKFVFHQTHFQLYIF